MPYSSNGARKTVRPSFAVTVSTLKTVTGSNLIFAQASNVFATAGSE